ncbi:MAG: NusG domain II-containing protein [Halanaerobium sp.]|nr:NusG domain II-containing protein [Halanaerobium sp.]
MKIGDKVIIGLIIIGAIASYFYFSQQPVGEEMTALIKVNNELYREIDLNGVKEPYELTITQSGGRYNVIRVEKGRIRILDANCPNKIGVKTGWLTAPGEMAVCLPYRVMVEITAGQVDSGVDGVAF